MTAAPVLERPQEISVSNPTTGEAIGALPVMGREDVSAAVAAARAAQPAWEALGV
jgi:acyl-CoA reductase-like NAD-dependent aldehyde dehydrogenase